MIARQIKADKIDPESITKETIKDNIYASYFLPPDLIVKSGKEKTLNGFLLWDSTYSKIFFSERRWPEFSKLDLLNALSFFQK